MNRQRGVGIVISEGSIPIAGHESKGGALFSTLHKKLWGWCSAVPFFFPLIRNGLSSWPSIFFYAFYRRKIWGKEQMILEFLEKTCHVLYDTQKTLCLHCTPFFPETESNGLRRVYFSRAHVPFSSGAKEHEVNTSFFFHVRPLFFFFFFYRRQKTG